MHSYCVNNALILCYLSALSRTRVILRSSEVELHFQQNGRDPGINSPVWLLMCMCKNNPHNKTFFPTYPSQSECHH